MTVPNKNKGGTLCWMQMKRGGDEDQTDGKVTDVPPQWRALDGKRVQLEGEMWAPNSASPKIPTFDLCYSIAKCCFNGPPQVQHFVKSTVVENGRVPYYSGLVKVTGVLHVDVKKSPEGKVGSVYQLDVERVEQ